MSFGQAGIKIEREKEFGALKGALERIFASPKAETFLKKLQGKGVRIRDFEVVLASGILEQVDEVLAESGTRAQALYGTLTPPDQGQMRELYLSRVEEVEPKLRTKFHKLYQY